MTAEKYDPLPDLALLLDAALHWGRDGAAYAERVAERIGLDADAGPEAAQRLLRAALELAAVPDCTERVPAGTAAVAVHAACAGVPEDEPEVSPRTVTLDVTDPAALHALTQALEDYAARERDQAAHEGGSRHREQWAEHADRMRGQAEAAG